MSFIRILMVALFVLPAAAEAEPRKAIRKGSLLRPPRRVASAPPLKYKYNSLLGLHLAQGSALVVGGQLGFPVSQSGNLFAGPEIDFSLYSPGSLLSLMGTVWYEIRLDDSPRLNLSLGAALGLALPDGLARFPRETYIALLDTAVSQEVDRDVYIRGQFRPGVIGKYFGFMMNLNVTFLIR